MWLTAREISQELHLSKDALHRLRKQRKIKFVKLGRNYRYAIPLPSEIVKTPAIERVAFITPQELSFIMRLSYGRIRAGICTKEYVPLRVGKRNYFTILEVRRILAAREHRKGQAKRGVSKLVIEWLQHYLEDKDEVPARILSNMLDQVGKMGGPSRSASIARLWDLFEEVDEILRKPKEQSQVTA